MYFINKIYNLSAVTMRLTVSVTSQIMILHYTPGG